MKGKIVIAGGTGLFGGHLTNYFKSNYTIVILTRSQKESIKDGVEYVQWDGKNIGDWVNHLDGAVALINLSGKSINCRFTEENKRLLLSSRLESTAVLREAILTLSHPPAMWLNASAGAMYQSVGGSSTEESMADNTGFLSEMALAWEAELFKGDLTQTKRVAMRISLLLGNDGGVFPVWKKITKLFLGGKVGSGKQVVSWMHINDAVRAVEYILEQSLDGPINFSSNHPVSNANLMQTLREKLKVPFGFPAPAFAIKLASPIVGAEPSLLLDSVNFVPKKLNDQGFNFKYNTFDHACEALIDE